MKTETSAPIWESSLRKAPEKIENSVMQSRIEKMTNWTNTQKAKEERPWDGS